MPQIPINPTDNDRLKTRKVQKMLGDLGVLPTRDSLKPTFLRSGRAAAALIDRALDGLAADPSLGKHCSRNSEDFATAINSKFAAAYLVDDGGAGLPAGAIAYADFKNGTYFYGGNALSDFLIQDTDWGVFDPATDIVAGTGLVSTTTAVSPSLAPALAAQIIGNNGFSATYDFILNTSEGNSSHIAADLFDMPNFSQLLVGQIDSAPNNSFVNDNNGQSSEIPTVTLDSLHRAAITLSSSHLALSIDGGSPVTWEVSDAFVCNFIGFNLLTAAWERFVLYPIKTDAELPALSALA